MGRIRLPKPVKLFVGLITNNGALIDQTKNLLVRKLGPVDHESELFDFSFTGYYNDEMGDNLRRKFLTFEKLVSLENIGSVKILTNKIENRLAIKDKRRINLDPGYVSLAALVLLTTKDYYHRIYLGKGIHAEVTLFYKDKTFRPLEWTYPDYRSPGYLSFFNLVREKYFLQTKNT
jgi:hypothetical protein